MLKKAITHEQYEKISDDLIVLGQNIIVKFTVGLTNYSEKFGRQSYHKEVEYPLSRAKGDVISIKRSFDYYMSIENIKSLDTGNKEFIRIGISEIYTFRIILEQTTQWFISKEYENLFAKKNNRIIILKRIEPLIINNLPMNKYIKFEPIVGTYLNSDEDYIALRLYLNSDNNYTDIPINRLMGFKYIIDSINMYESAQLLLNYIQRPEYGANMYSINQDNTNTEYNVDVKNGRKLEKNKSYFDKMKELES